MPTTIKLNDETKYVCGICGSINDFMATAVLCEEKGKPVEYEPGTIFGDHSKGSRFPDFVFAVAANNPIGHINYLTCWSACRDPLPALNSLPPAKGVIPWSSPLTAEDGRWDSTHSAMVKMLAALVRACVPALFWDGEKAVISSFDGSLFPTPMCGVIPIPQTFEV